MSEGITAYGDIMWREGFILGVFVGSTLSTLSCIVYLSKRN